MIRNVRLRGAGLIGINSNTTRTRKFVLKAEYLSILVESRSLGRFGETSDNASSFKLQAQLLKDEIINN
jgi:hypothetical protein